MQARTIAMARCDLPVPVPPISTALRCWTIKPPPARSRISAWLIGVPVKSKSSISLANGNLAMVIWYLIERACLLGNLGAEQFADNARRLVPPLDSGRHHFVIGSAHAVKLE